MINPNDVLTYDELKQQRDCALTALVALMGSVSGQKVCGHNYECNCAWHDAKAAVKYCTGDCPPPVDNTPAQFEALAGGAPCKDA